jgi:hypothetical protein
MQDILHEARNTFCQLMDGPPAVFAFVILIHLGVMVYNSEPNDDLLNLLLNPF